MNDFVKTGIGLGLVCGIFAVFGLRHKMSMLGDMDVPECPRCARPMKKNDRTNPTRWICEHSPYCGGQRVYEKPKREQVKTTPDQETFKNEYEMALWLDKEYPPEKSFPTYPDGVIHWHDFLISKNADMSRIKGEIGVPNAKEHGNVQALMQARNEVYEYGEKANARLGPEWEKVDHKIASRYFSYDRWLMIVKKYGYKP